MADQTQLRRWQQRMQAAQQGLPQIPTIDPRQAAAAIGAASAVQPVNAFTPTNIRPPPPKQLRAVSPGMQPHGTEVADPKVPTPQQGSQMPAPPQIQNAPDLSSILRALRAQQA